MQAQTVATAKRPRMRSAKETQDLVVLTHGLLASKWVMQPLAIRLRELGFETRLRGYGTTHGSMQDKGERFAEYLQQLADENPGRNIHVVAHSMGSILTRCALLSGVPERMGRIVMIGPPNQGSHIATKLAPFCGWLVPTLNELSDQAGSFVNRLPTSVGDYEVGIIAASHDNVIHAGKTELDDHKDHVTLDYMHTSILWREQTAAQVASFLREGRFVRNVNQT